MNELKIAKCYQLNFFKRVHALFEARLLNALLTNWTVAVQTA